MVTELDELITTKYGRERKENIMPGSPHIPPNSPMWIVALPIVLLTVLGMILLTKCF